MQRNYLTIKNFLEEEFPELRGKITGGNYPPPPYTVIMMQILSAIHLLAIVFVMFGDAVWSYIPYFSSHGPPELYKTAKQYPMQTFVILLFVIPTLVQSKVTTGAFEIALDGNIVFSKISSGRFPDGPELIELFQKFLS